MASSRYYKAPGAAKGTYLPCKNCHEKVCICIELYLMRALNVAGLPEPEKQIKFCSTRGWKSDFGYVDKKILIEVEGGGGIGRHSSASGYREDCVKYNSAALLGWVVLRFDKALISSGIAVEMIRAALAGEVWVPEHPTGRRKIVSKTTGSTPSNRGVRIETKTPKKDKNPENAQKRTKKHKNAQNNSPNAEIIVKWRDPSDPVEIAKAAILNTPTFQEHLSELQTYDDDGWKR